MTATLAGGNVRIVRGSYRPFRYTDEAVTIPLLGKNPALADKNEVVQSNALRSREAECELYATSSAERDTIEATLFTQTTFNPDDGTGSHNVNVVRAEVVAVEGWALGTPGAYIIALKVRER